jgi:hypothetical protein
MPEPCTFSNLHSAFPGRSQEGANLLLAGVHKLKRLARFSQRGLASLG